MKPKVKEKLRTVYAAMQKESGLERGDFQDAITQIVEERPTTATGWITGASLYIYRERAKQAEQTEQADVEPEVETEAEDMDNLDECLAVLRVLADLGPMAASRLCEYVSDSVEEKLNHVLGRLAWQNLTAEEEGKLSVMPDGKALMDKHPPVWEADENEDTENEDIKTSGVLDLKAFFDTNDQVPGDA